MWVVMQPMLAGFNPAPTVGIGVSSMGQLHPTAEL